MLQRLSSSIKVQIKYCFLRGDTLYWQRRVPTDLADRYTSKLLKVNLKTNDLNKAAKLVERLNQQHEAEWEPTPPTPSINGSGALGLKRLRMNFDIRWPTDCVRWDALRTSVRPSVGGELMTWQASTGKGTR